MSAKATLLDCVRAELSAIPNVSERRMFGATAFLVSRKLCISADANSIMCRIDPTLHDAALEWSGCRTYLT